ncbi:MAG: TPM domain-containing protein [Janthinobacterium lividum]
MVLTDDDRARVAAAVTAAEATTDAEVAVIAAPRSDEYRDAALHWVVLAMLLMIAAQAFAPDHFAALLDVLPGADRWGEGVPVADLLALAAALAALMFLAGQAVFRTAAMRVAAAPHTTRARRVRRRAILLFRTGIEARTATRTGVLLYLSIAERRAEIVADAAVTRLVPPEAWGEAMVALTAELKAGRAGDGLVAAIGRIGAVLATHFPHTGTDPNELPDRLIEL